MTFQYDPSTATSISSIGTSPRRTQMLDIPPVWRTEPIPHQHTVFREEVFTARLVGQIAERRATVSADADVAGIRSRIDRRVQELSGTIERDLRDILQNAILELGQEVMDPVRSVTGMLTAEIGPLRVTFHARANSAQLISVAQNNVDALVQRVTEDIGTRLDRIVREEINRATSRPAHTIRTHTRMTPAEADASIDNLLNMGTGESRYTIRNDIGNTLTGVSLDDIRAAHMSASTRKLNTGQTPDKENVRKFLRDNLEIRFMMTKGEGQIEGKVSLHFKDSGEEICSDSDFVNIED